MAPIGRCLGHVTQFLKLNKLTYLLQIWYRDGGHILPAYEPQNDL